MAVRPRRRADRIEPRIGAERMPLYRLFVVADIVMVVDRILGLLGR